jgi:hypothetical protein
MTRETMRRRAIGAGVGSPLLGTKATFAKRATRKTTKGNAKQTTSQP